MSSSSAAHPDTAHPLSKRTRSTTLPEQTPNKQARVSASAGALDGVRRLQNILPRRLTIASPRSRKVRPGMLRRVHVDGLLRACLRVQKGFLPRKSKRAGSLIP